MNITAEIITARNTAADWHRNGQKIGFVPTMGYLHEGHISLIKRAKKENDRLAVSIFVNPAQFAEGEDYEDYPRDHEHDADICDKAGVDLLFMPNVKEMYPQGFQSGVQVEQLSRGLCGQSRPGHFKGVCTVVAKLFNIILPDRAYFGQKDSQQLAVIRRMALDLNFPVEIVACPVVREPDGLAKSSRNVYLNPSERKAAAVLYNSIQYALRLIKNGEDNPSELIKLITEFIKSEPLARIDYVHIVNRDTLRPVNSLTDSPIIMLAVFIGSTRLIDAWEL